MAWLLRGCLIGCVVLLGQASSGIAADPPDGHPRTVYFSVGDTQDLLEFPPLDSRASIVAALDTLRDQWQVDRVWWRGGQDEVWGEQFVIRPENRQFAKTWDWWRDLQYRKVGTNRIAVEEAHRRSMSIWLTYGLFDNGSQADAGYSGFPYAVEDKLRVEHPEWAPVNRWGTWRQGGPIEFAYPEARQAMADYLARYVIDGGYDGISFLTYAENFSQRYEDEFGYGDPIVEQYRAEYGKDIRKEEFDRNAWRRIRGGHVTEFLRSLKKQLAPLGKQIAVCVHGQAPDRPMLWNVSGGVRTAGNFTWSVDEWLKGDVVDEICLFAPENQEAMEKLLARGQNAKSPVKITAFRSRGPLPAAMPRIMFLGREIESGYIAEAWVDYPDEQLAGEPVGSLASDDVNARRRVVTLALKGRLTLSAPQLSAALGDPDLYVRRSALRTIARYKPPGTYGAALEALGDAENSVRCLAGLALVELPHKDVVSGLLAAAFRADSTFQFHYRAVPDALKRLASTGRFGEPERQILIQHLADRHPRTRELALYCLTLVGAPATPEVETALARIAIEDENSYSRELALVNLRSSFGATKTVAETVRRVIQQDPDHAVQVRAAAALAGMHARLDTSDPRRAAALEELVGFFRQYGSACQRTDREWGWRLLGNSLLEFGPPAEQEFQELMAEAEDRALCDRAWRILYLKQADQSFPMSPEEDEAAHRMHPWRR